MRKRNNGIIKNLEGRPAAVPARHPVSETASPTPINAPFVSNVHRLKHLGGVGMHVESRELVAAHSPDVGEGRRK